MAKPSVSHRRPPSSQRPRSPLWAACLLSLAASALGCDSGGTGATTRTDTILALPADAVAGAQVFGDFCGNENCHGADGNSGPAADLGSVSSGLSDAQLVTTIIKGTDSMPALSLSDQEVADVVAYVNENFM